MRISWKTVVAAYSSNWNSSALRMADLKLFPNFNCRLFSERRIVDVLDGSRSCGTPSNVRGAPKRLTVGFGKTAGRNSSGRITSFHRGGGAKRLQRKVDLKRNMPSVGIIQRIDYDPNRSSRLALVRWVDDAPPSNENPSQPSSRPLVSCLTLDAAATTVAGKFSLSSVCGQVDERKVPCFSTKPHSRTLMVGVDANNLPVNVAAKIEFPNPRDVFLRAFTSKGKQNKCITVGIPRIAVAGAIPSYTSTENAEEIVSKYDVKKWDLNSSYWRHRIKRKAAVSWKS